MGEQPFDPSILNIMNLAGKNGGDNLEFEEIHSDDGDDQRQVTIDQTSMTNAQPRVD